MKKTRILFALMAGVAILGISGAAHAELDTHTSTVHTVLGNNLDEGVAAYNMPETHRDMTLIEPAAGDEKLSITNAPGPRRLLGNNPDGIAGYTAADQKLEWQFMQRHHPAAIEPAGGGHGNVPSQGTFNKFFDDPFGDIED